MKRKRLQQIVINSSTSKNIILLFVILYLHFRQTLSSLRPRDVFFPASLAQLIIFITAAHTESFILYSAIGNLLITALAIFPSTYQRKG